MALKHLNQGNFDDTLKSDGGFHVVDFFATWCGPCKMMGPVLEQAQKQIEDVNFYKVDIDQDSSLAERYQILSVPTLLFFKGDKLIDKSVGVISKDDMKHILAKYA